MTLSKLSRQAALWIRPALVAGVTLGVAMVSGGGQAATPASGTVDGTGAITWQFAPIAGAELRQTSEECPSNACDNFDLTVKLPQPAAQFYVANHAQLLVTGTWDTGASPSNILLFVFGPEGNRVVGGQPQTSGKGSDYIVLNDPPDGLYHVRVTPPNAEDSTAPLATPTTVSGSAVLTMLPRAASPISSVFQNYEPGGTIGQGAGEPSIGVDWDTGAVMFQAGLETLRATFDDHTVPAAVTWKDVQSVTTGTQTLDPILYTDAGTGRTFVSQDIAACSLMAYTDDDGATWTPTQGCDFPPGFDHQSVGSGPFPSTAGAIGTYPRAIWYCSDNVVDGVCGYSQDGGMTFHPGTPTYSGDQCVGLMGHVAVGPDGTAYVPNKNCLPKGSTATCGSADPANGNTPLAGGNYVPGQKALAVSTDGVSWTVNLIPHTSTKAGPDGCEHGTSDPSVGVGPKGTIYFGLQNGDGHPLVAVSRDHGSTWGTPTDVGTAFGIQNTQFATITVGDDNRAAFAFLGTQTPGDDQSATFGCVLDSKGNATDCPAGFWHLYVATTMDGGATWKTIDATPAKPVQRGCIWNGGGSNPCRNLLDFMGMTIDKTGRILVGYADGCTGPCATSTLPKDNGYTAVSAISRQTCGNGLLAAYDGTLPACGAPRLANTAAPTGSGVNGQNQSVLPNTSGLAVDLTPELLLMALMALLPLGLLGARRARRLVS
ncbi:MAG: sialidase family protein [Candidatus Dormibacteria bacterium]